MCLVETKLQLHNSAKGNRITINATWKILNTKCLITSRYIIKSVDIEISTMPILTQLHIHFLRSINPTQNTGTFTVTHMVVMVGTQAILDSYASFMLWINWSVKI